MVQKTVPAAELYFSAIPDMDKVGEKTLVAIYNKTFKGELAATPIVANATFKVAQQIQSIKVTQQPTRRTYYVYTSAATAGLGDRTMAFDPTGLVVTATYGNGETAVIDNAKLTFSPVTASAGTRSVTITTANGKTARTTVTVEDSKTTAAPHARHCGPRKTTPPLVGRPFGHVQSLGETVRSRSPTIPTARATGTTTSASCATPPRASMPWCVPTTMAGATAMPPPSATTTVLPTGHRGSQP
jgi:hypothetical protein